MFLVGWHEYVVGEVLATLAEGDWQRLSAGPGNKGERWYNWQCLVLAEATDADKGYYLLSRLRLRAAAAVASLSRVGPPACDVPTLIRIAGSCWRIESAFEMARQEVGLDENEVRNAQSWDHHMILTLLSVGWAASLLPPDS